MAVYTADVEWTRGDQTFVDGRYSRVHRIRFDGGVDIEGSASPHVVRAPFSSETGVDPEEMLVASLSTCHMLTFLHLAQKAGLQIDSYRDAAQGRMGKTAQGRFAVTRVTLRPEIAFGGERRPTAAELDDLHHRAHEECFIANSVTTEVVVEPVQESVHA
jgi:organic hydroperoxide reductase OsmC/OhrA